MSKLWGGRFESQTDKDVEIFTTSINLDYRLWRADIHCSLAHAKMLQKTKIISEAEGESIISALNKIETEFQNSFENGTLTFSPQAEDIHSVIETKLYELLGNTAGKLHTARSRNDQIATDLRYYLRGEISEFIFEIRELQKWIIQTSEKHVSSIMPGLTHMQHGQPVSLAHHLMAYFWMFERDISRLNSAIQRMNILPLGSGALAGTSLPIDRQFVCKELNFTEVSQNSLDAVSDRDFVLELTADFSILMGHVSRIAEELILWSTPEFNFIELSDKVTTGSSLMPQKKNPDVAELIRGRTGRVYGALMGLCTLVKALPLSYNRDLQEDKYHLFEALDTVRSSVRLMHLILKDAVFKTQNMEATLKGDGSNATDIADFLVKKGVAFRDAHEVSGKLVLFSIKNNRPLESLTLKEFQYFHNLFDENILKEIKHNFVMNARTSEGGTGQNAVLNQIEKAKSVLKN